MCTSRTLFDGNIGRVVKLNRGRDCAGCPDKVSCCICDKQACYQRLGISCANTDGVSIPLCVEHQNKQSEEDMMRIIRSL
jgi:hypothetical protein